MQVVGCDDFTCRHNEDGICKREDLVIKVGADHNDRIVNICESYEDNRNVSM